MIKPAPFKSGDSVVVKAQVTDPDFGLDMSGWQGHIAEIPAALQGINTGSSVSPHNLAVALPLLALVPWALSSRWVVQIVI